MNHLIRLIVLTLGGLIANIAISSTLTEEANKIGINSTCATYLGQLEESFKLSGLTLTSAYQTNPSLNSSLHTKIAKFSDGATFISTTLSPDGEFCDISITISTHTNISSCAEIIDNRLSEDQMLKVNSLLDGKYHIINRENDNFTIVLIDTGKKSCMYTETQMMWPGR